jgi:hypothetical protein
MNARPLDGIADQFPAPLLVSKNGFANFVFERLRSVKGTKANLLFHTVAIFNLIIPCERIHFQFS